MQIRVHEDSSFFKYLRIYIKMPHYGAVLFFKLLCCLSVKYSVLELCEIQKKTSREKLKISYKKIYHFRQIFPRTSQFSEVSHFRNTYIFQSDCSKLIRRCSFDRMKSRFSTYVEFSAFVFHFTRALLNISEETRIKIEIDVSSGCTHSYFTQCNNV